MTTKTANLELVEVEDQDVGAGAAPGFNESYDKLDALVQLSVISASTNAPPVTPRQGDRYIVPTTVSGGNAWTAFARRVAYYGADGWIFMTPKPGWEAYVQDADRTFIFRTTDWADIGFILASTLTTKGDLLGAGAGGSAARVPAAASNNQALISDSSQASGMAWKSLLTSKGQLLGFDGTNLVAISVGADGTVLTGAAAATAGWNWQTPSGGGGGGTTLSAAILADAPFAFWKGDDAATKLVDSSGNGFDMTTVNGTVGYQQSPLIPTLPSTSFALVGTFANASGSNGWAITSQLGRTYPLLNWSAEIVFFPMSFASGTYRLIDGRPNGSSTTALSVLFTPTAGLVLFYPAAGNTNTVPIPSSNVPCHVVITCSTTSGTSTLIFYVNGIRAGSFTATAATLTGTMVWQLGGLANVSAASASFLFGYLALFASALTPAKVATHAAAAGKFGV